MTHSRHAAGRMSSGTRQFIVLVTVLSVVGCGGSDTVPTTPTGGSGSAIVSLDVSCPTSLLIGQGGPCIAVADSGFGQAIAFDAAWSSTRPEVATVDARGIVTGRSAGQAAITASYAGRQGTALVSVTAEDALRITAAAQQGEFRPGTTVTMWLQGYYSVASADAGRLSLRITDQAGTVTTSSPRTVSMGGDFFLLFATFVVPPGSTEVCRTAILEIGSVTIAEPTSNESGLRCISIRP